MSFKIFTYLAQLLLTFWAYSLGVLRSIAVCSKGTAQTSELPMFTEPFSKPVSVMQVPASPVEVLSYSNQVVERICSESPVSSCVDLNIDRQSPETPTPSFRKKHMRRTHVLFPPIVAPNNSPHNSSAIESTPPSAATTPTECQNTPTASPISSYETSFLSTKAEENFTGASSDASTISSIDDDSSASSTPLSLSPTTPQLPYLPIEVSVVVSPDDDTCPSPNDTTGQTVRIRDIIPTYEIGSLGKRRGFKGAPLFTSATAKKSTFLEVPLTARSPLASVTNLIKTSTPKSAKQRAMDTKQVPATLQEDFDFNDPFGTGSESYYAPDAIDTATPYANLYNFSAYQTGTPTRTPTLKRKPAMLDLHSPLVNSATPKPTTPLTNIYDISIHQYDDEPPTKATLTRFKSNSRSREARPRESVEFKLTPPSAPSSPHKSDSPSLDLDQVQILSPSMPDTESIMSVLGDYAYYREDFTPMEPALPDSPVIPRAHIDPRIFDFAHLGRPFCAEEGGDSIVDQHTSENTLRSIPETEIPNNDGGVDDDGRPTESINDRHTSQSEIQSNSIIETVNGDGVDEDGRLTESSDDQRTSQTELQISSNTDTPNNDSVINDDHSAESTSESATESTSSTETPQRDGVNHNQFDDRPKTSSGISLSEHCHPESPTRQLLRERFMGSNSLSYGRSSRSASQAPKRSSGLRPLFLPMMIARSQDSQTFTAASTKRHSYPNTHINREPITTPSCQNCSNANSSSHLPRPYSLPSYWPTPAYRTEATATSSPKRRSNALDDILNLLDGAGFHVSTKSGTAPHSGSSNDAHSYDDARTKADMTCFDERRLSDVGVQPAYAI